MKNYKRTIIPLKDFNEVSIAWKSYKSIQNNKEKKENNFSLLIEEKESKSWNKSKVNESESLFNIVKDKVNEKINFRNKSNSSFSLSETLSFDDRDLQIPVFITKNDKGDYCFLEKYLPRKDREVFTKNSNENIYKKI